MGREWPYKNVQPRIIAEQYYADDLRDYKLFGFDAMPRMKLVCSVRFTKDGVKDDFYDEVWNHLNVQSPVHGNAFFPILRSKQFELIKMLTVKLSEVTVSGYSTNTEKTTDGNGYTVTNTHSPLKRNISVYKKWDDSNDLDGLRKDVVLTLKGSDGSVYNGKITKDAIDQEYTFKNLYAYDSGKEIEYTIEEQEMKGYTVSIAEAKDGFTITNTHKAVGKKPVTEDNPDKWDDSDTIIEKIIDIPKTGDSFKLIIYGLCACAALAAGIGTGVISARKKKDEE